MGALEDSLEDMLAVTVVETEGESLEKGEAVVGEDEGAAVLVVEVGEGAGVTLEEAESVVGEGVAKEVMGLLMLAGTGVGAGAGRPSERRMVGGELGAWDLVVFNVD